MNVGEAIADFLGITPQRGDEWTIQCPSPEHTDRRPSASIYVGEPQERMRGTKKIFRLPGMWICYSCGRSGRVLDGRIESYEPSADRNLEVALEQLEPAEQRLYPESWLSLFNYPGGVHPKWLERFTEATCARHRLGYDHERNAGTYPFRTTDGQVLGVVRRNFGDDDWKYRYPFGVDKSRLLYGYHWAVREDATLVVLTEGALDAVAVDEAGARGLAIYGSRISEEQVHLINRLYPRTVLLAFDNDEAGRAATERVLSMDLACSDVLCVPLGHYKDIAEIPLPERIEVVASAVTVT